MAKVQLKLVAVALLVSMCVLLPFTSAKSAKFDYCEKKVDYAVKVSGIDINPSPVARGKPATFTIAAATDKAISGGKLNVDVYYFGLSVHSESHDLCSKIPCPVSPGGFSLSHSQELPGYTPPGSYTVQFTMLDDEKQQLTCFNFGFSIWFGGSEALADS